MKSLVKVLLNNGTGMLQGLCRRADLEPFRDTQDYSEVGSFKIVFSVNEINLGTFLVTPVSHDEDLHCHLMNPELEKKNYRIFIRIGWKEQWDFPVFKAYLEKINI